MAAEQSTKAARIDSLVQKYFAALASHDVEVLTQVLHFRTPEAEKRFATYASIAECVPTEPWREKMKAIIALRPANRVSGRYTCLTPFDEKSYWPQTIEVEQINGRLRVVAQSRAFEREGTLSPDDGERTRMQKEMHQWKKARGTDLIEKVRQFKRRFEEQIKALQYAQRHRIPIMSQYGDLASGREVYQQIRDMSPTDLRSFVVAELESSLRECGGTSR